MNARIKKLREESSKAKPYITPERARLLTDFYRENDRKSISGPVMRALAFKHLLEYKAVCINEGEFIVGERGPAPKATPTYPEITAHSMEDLEILDYRSKTSFSVDEETKTIYREEIIPFWKDKSIRDLIFKEMSGQWISCFRAGVFTEFMEQRAPGHTVLDDKIHNKGLLDFKEEIEDTIARLDFLTDPEAYKKKEELAAMAISIEALILYANRHAQKALELAEKEKDRQRKAELERVASICTRVPAQAPRGFWEALQHYWFIHLGVIIEYNTWDSFNPE